MRLHLAESDFTAEGFSDEARPQTYDANAAKIFYMLTAGFYSRPLESMFREICANAFDEHKHAKRPFLVVLPHTLQPELVIRDFGRGMDHAFVMHKSMSIGYSTKDQTDEAIGGYGLGLKTPFTVTEQFAIVIYRGNVKQTYVIDRQGGTPRVITDAAMIETLDAPQTGTELRIPIPENKWSELKDVARRILALFPQGSFEIIGAHVPPLEYVRETPAYAVLKQSTAPTYARMACIAYRLDLQALFGDEWQSMGAPESGLELRFENGELDLIPNREALLLNDRTRDAVRGALAKALADFEADFVAQVNKAPTYWEACYSFLDQLRASGNAAKFLPKKVRWQNAERGAYIDGLETPPVITSWSMSDLGRYKSPKPAARDRLHIEFNIHRAAQEPSRWALVLDDCAGQKQYLKRAHLVRAHLAKSNQYGLSRIAFVTRDWLETMDVPRGAYLLASDFEPPKPERVKQGGGYLKGKRRAYRSDRYSGRTSSHWKACEAYLQNGGFYIPFSGSSAIEPRATALANHVWMKDAFTAQRPCIYGLPKGLCKGLDPSAWINAREFIEARASRLVSSPLLARSLAWQRLKSAARYENRDLWELLLAYHPRCDLFGALKNKIQAMRPQAMIEARDLNALARLHEQELMSAETRARYEAALAAPCPLDIDAEFSALLKARPLFAHILGDLDAFTARGEAAIFWRALEVQA